jgi:hypothetical protein
MVTVPQVPPLFQDPTVLMIPDCFNRPCPLRPDLVLDVTAQSEGIAAMLAYHASQGFEWLPYEEGRLDEVAGNENWAMDWLRPHARGRAEHFREALAERFGDAAREIEWCEVYEISEYGRALDEKVKAKLFG